MATAVGRMECFNALLVLLYSRLPTLTNAEILLRVTRIDLCRQGIDGRFCNLELRNTFPDFSWRSMLMIGRQTRKKICGQTASSPDCSSNPILPYCISIVFKFLVSDPGPM